MVSASPIGNRLSGNRNHNLLSNIRSSRKLISFQNFPSRPTSPAGGKAQCTRGPSSGNKGLRVLLSCRRPVSDPLWLIGPRAACLSRAPGHPKRPIVVKVLNPAKGRGLNFKNFQNGGGPTIFKVFRVCYPATMPGHNSENSENGSGPTVFRVFRVPSPAHVPVPVIHLKTLKLAVPPPFSEFSELRFRTVGRGRNLENLRMHVAIPLTKFSQFRNRPWAAVAKL